MVFFSEEMIQFRALENGIWARRLVDEFRTVGDRQALATEKTKNFNLKEDSWKKVKK